MESAARRTRRTLAGGVIAVILAVLVLAACGGSAQGHAAGPARGGGSGRPAASSSSAAPSAPASPDPAGTAGSYSVGERQLTFTEPAHTAAGGQPIGPRTLVTEVRYPLAQGSARQPAQGPLPLLVFGPGFLECVDTYGDLLQTWASAGYVVAAVTFPRTNCQAGTAAYEPDLVNQPADMSFVISSLLDLSAQPHDLFSGLLNGTEIGAAGQSDGGDTVAALAASTCCTDHRLKAVAVLSGAEWPAMPGQYFSGGAPPMLFVQGNADPINPPWASLQLYRLDEAGARYYLNLLGASHMTPYEGTNPVERVVARVTLAFFDRYVLGQAGALAAMTRAGTVSGTAALVSGGHVPADAG